MVVFHRSKKFGVLKVHGTPVNLHYWVEYNLTKVVYHQSNTKFVILLLNIVT